MPNDVLAEEVNEALRGASEFISSDRTDEIGRANHVKRLDVARQRLESEIAKRSAEYITELDDEKNKRLDALRQKEKAKKVEEAVQNQAACQQTFDNLRQVNDGAYPRNVSPVLYAIPLVLLGVAEWYVNYSTFASHFVPLFAIASTLIVAAVFAGASHLHGEYLRQLSEMLHPSLEYRRKIDRQLILIIVSVLLLIAFTVVVWLRYDLVAEQLGVNSASGNGGAFGGPSSEMVWSRVGPTIFMNFLIWGIGTVYSWAVHERVPNLRESYRALLRANSRLEKIRRPIAAEETQIRAKYEVESRKNQVAIREYQTKMDSVQDALKRFNSDASGKSEAQVLRKVQ